MGSKQSTVENGCIKELSKINEEELDISRIDKIVLKTVKNLSERVEKLEREKQNKILYKLPDLQFCNASLI
jgi:hypothetical protein